MCGWVAVMGRKGQAPSRVQLLRAMAALVHRGPDDAGEHHSGPVALGFRRLSIIDLSMGGHQPMSTADEQLTLVFNGEIYNYRELRRELVGLGHAFKSSSDTEVLLTAYRAWGPKCVDRFNGMFSFVVLNQSDGSLFGARDRLGVKPMYFWQSDDWVVLASEPGAIGATGLVELRPNLRRLHEGLAQGRMDHHGGTCLQGVQQVPGGHTVTVDPIRGVRHEAFWSLPPAPEPGGPAKQVEDAQWIGQLSELISDAVALRLRSDVPVGFTLSGGIDSSLLICEAAHQGNGDLKAFCYQDRAYDECRQITDTAAQTGASLHSVADKELDIAALLPQVIAANGEPVHSMAAVANYALFGLASQNGVKVLLGGQGADEVFAGYRNFQRDYWQTLCADWQWAELVSDVKASAQLHGHGVGKLLVQTCLQTLRVAASHTGAYRALRSRKPASWGRASSGLFSPDLAASGTELEPTPLRLRDGLRVAATVTPLPLYLRVEDRVSMAHSVEARLPFTDYRIVEHALRMPDHLRFARGINKVALRAAATLRVPASVSQQTRKLGFPVAHSERTAQSLQSLCQQLAANQAFRERGIYNHGLVQALLSKTPQMADVGALFDLAQTELWLLDLHRRQAPQVAA